MNGPERRTTAGNRRGGGALGRFDRVLLLAIPVTAILVAAAIGAAAWSLVTVSAQQAALRESIARQAESRVVAIRELCRSEVRGIESLNRVRDRLGLAPDPLRSPQCDLLVLDAARLAERARAQGP